MNWITLITLPLMLAVVSMTLFLLIRFVGREKDVGQWILCAVLAALIVLTVATNGNFLFYVPPIFI